MERELGRAPARRRFAKRAERRRGRWRVPAIERGARVTVVRQRSPARRQLAESSPERRNGDAVLGGDRADGPRVTAVRRRAPARRQLADSARRRAESTGDSQG